MDDDNNCGGYCSPVIIDTAGNGYELTSAERGVAFDIDADGVLNQISWTAAGSDDAFLWLDENGNGVVDDGAELFGDAVYDNGFDKMKALDGNHDGRLDATDAVWSSLRLWTDLNHNGVSEAFEISAVASSHLSGIGVDYQIVGRRDRYGNLYRYKGLIYTAEDASGKDHVYDVFLVQAR